MEKERQNPPAPAGGSTPLSILAAFAKTPQLALSLPELQQASGMDFLAFSQAIQRLQEAGYITVSGAPGQERVSLTKLGTDVASLAG
jgi:hypothetical protein